MLRTRALTLSPNARPQSSALRRVQKLNNLPLAQRILGVDPGLHRTGYGLIESDLQSGGNCVKLVEGGVLRAKASDEFPIRLRTLHEGLCEVIAELQPEIVVIEDLFSTYAHPRSALLMAHARGVLILAAGLADLPVHSFTPNEIKQVVAGNGHATKSAIQAAVKARLKLSATLHPPDLADALAIAICYAIRADMGAKLT